jgi:hypothetical protein
MHQKAFEKIALKARRVAYHESGHAVAALLSRGCDGIAVMVGKFASRLPPDYKPVPGATTFNWFGSMHWRAVVVAAGHAAELEFFDGDYSNDADDQANIERLIHTPSYQGSFTRDMVEDDADALVSHHRDTIERVANELLKNGFLDQAAITKLVE